MTFKVGDRVRYGGESVEVIDTRVRGYGGAQFQVLAEDGYVFWCTAAELGSDTRRRCCPTCNGAGWVRDGGGDDTE